MLQSCPTLCDSLDWSLPGPLTMGFSRQEYWSGLPCPPPGDLPDPGIELVSIMSPVLSVEFFTTNFPDSSDCKKNCLQYRRSVFNPWVGKIPWRRKWQLTPIFLPGKSCGQRSLAGYSPWGHKVKHDWATNTFIFSASWEGWQNKFGVFTEHKKCGWSVVNGRERERRWS